jgi:hypothetical protein
MFLHIPAMLKDYRALSAWVLKGWDGNSDVALFGDRLGYALAHGISFRALVSKLRAASGAAKTPQPTSVAPLWAVWRHLFPALDAISYPVRFIFSHTGVGAFARAIDGVFAPCLSVSAKFARRLHDRFAARLASESEPLCLHGILAPMNFFMSTVAISAAKFLHLCVSVLACVSSAALNAGFLGWHCWHPSVMAASNDSHTRGSFNVNPMLMGVT